MCACSIIISFHVFYIIFFISLQTEYVVTNAFTLQVNFGDWIT